jgi:hypothetical protein
MRLEIGKQRLAMAVIECRLAGLYAVKHPAVSTPEHIVAVDQCGASQRSGRIALQEARRRREREGLSLSLGEDPDAGERPHQAIERARLGANVDGQVGRRSRTLVQAVGKLELGGDVDHLA